MRRRPLFRRRRRRRWVLVALLVAVAVAGGAFGQLTRAPDEEPDGAGALAAPTSPGRAPSAEPVPTAAATTAADGSSSTPTSEPVAVGWRLPDQRPDLRPGDERLQERLRATIAALADSLEGAQVQVAVRDAAGRRVLDHGPSGPMMPASTMKAVTAATVLATLGPDHRFTTRLAATGPIEDGVLRGDLVVVGAGDPVLSTDDYRTHVYPSRPATEVERLVDAVVEAGIERVTGRVLADATAWGGSPTAPGWRTAYLDDHNARRIHALTVDAGLRVKAEVPDDGPVSVELTGVPDPPRYTAGVVTRMLRDRDVEVRGRPAAASAPVATTSTVGTVASPPVSELLRFAMERSDNHLADTLVRAAAHGASGRGSWAAADQVAGNVLEALGVDGAGLRVADGSGLSRLDRVTAAQLADLDVAMMRGDAADVWQDSLARAGHEGTLRNRLVGTAGQGRVYGKSGTLDDVKAVVAHVVGPDSSEPRYHVAVVGNGEPFGGRSAVTVLMDRLQLVLVDQLDGCRTQFAASEPPERTCRDGG